MLASRMLQPVVQSSPPLHPLPIAIFFSVPRRYIKSTMRVQQASSQSPIDDSKSSHNLRKSSRIQETRSTLTIDSTTKLNHKEEPMSADGSSAQSTRRRPSSLMEISEGEESASPTDEKPPASATSATARSPDFAGHVCLCQPEPKIPRPRNGEFEHFLCLEGDLFSNQIVIIRGLCQNKECLFSLLTAVDSFYSL
jgi:hypothetical protein